MADWSNWPMNKDVSWPIDEKIIGVLGVAPIATADFIKTLVSRPIERDWMCPRILVDINTKIPSRGRFFELSETDPTPFIRHGIESLHARGADFVVIPCNTAHILYERFTVDAQIPVPHIVDVTVKCALESGISNALILCSDSVRKYKLYEDAIADKPLTVTHFPDQSLISSGIEVVKKNKSTDIISLKIKRLITDMHDIDGIIFGCTEIGLLMSGFLSPFPVIDSSQALADFCFKYANNMTKTENIRIRHIKTEW